MRRTEHDLIFLKSGDSIWVAVGEPRFGLAVKPSHDGVSAS